MSEDGLPNHVVTAALRLTRLAQRAPNGDVTAESALKTAERYREDRAVLLEEHGYRARIREDDRGRTLVCYPADWLSDGEANMEAIEDTDLAVERRLDGTGGSREWEDVAAHNRRIADAVETAHGDPHGRTAQAFARFMSSHRVRHIETATAADILEFVDEFFRRNSWPTEEQWLSVMRSLRITIGTALER
jgi:hypothetical protein